MAISPEKKLEKKITKLRKDRAKYISKGDWYEAEQVSNEIEEIKEEMEMNV